jgi:lipid-binding SYLF domain-containing protein
MRAFILGFLLTGIAIPALAVDKTDLDRQVRRMTAKFEALQAKPDKRIAAEQLSKAEGIILLDRTKAGFVFAYQGGRGVALVKDPVTRQWSSAAFLIANEASLGFQVGGQQSFIVILLMNTNATRTLTDATFEFGGEARGTAGKSTAGAAGTVSLTERPVLVYDDRKGLYGGAAIKGDAITPDTEANRVYYGQFLTLKDIVFDHKVEPTEAVMHLAEKITDHSKVAAN